MKKEMAGKKNVRLLLVDDDPAVRKILKTIVEHSFDFRISEAATGIAAVREYIIQQPDIVIMDVNMPGMDGIEALKKIKECNEDARVIIISGKDENRIPALKAGAHVFIKKPIHAQELIDFIHYLLP